jgi:hypothetical protein
VFIPIRPFPRPNKQVSFPELANEDRNRYPLVLRLATLMERAPEGTGIRPRSTHQTATVRSAEPIDPLCHEQCLSCSR